MGHKLWKITKIAMLSVSFLIYAFFMLRLCSGGDPESMKQIIWNETACAAYTQSPETFEALEQEQQVIISDDGKFWISQVVYLPQARQLQLTIKYNNSTLTRLKDELIEAKVMTEEDELPAEPFVYSLLDNEGNRYFEHSEVSAHKQNYNYRRLVFENIDLTDIPTMYVDIYYVGAADYEKRPYGSMMTWNAALPLEKRNVEKELPDSLK